MGKGLPQWVVCMWPRDLGGQEGLSVPPRTVFFSQSAAPAPATLLAQTPPLHPRAT